MPRAGLFSGVCRREGARFGYTPRNATEWDDAQEFLEETFLPALRQAVGGIAGYRITPVLVFWTLRVLHWVEFTFETGFELPSSCLVLPGYASNLNRNILDFVK
jgi:hypothetical protein